jgi:hypothetical protein
VSTILRWLSGFARFWYGFIVGDDWTVAAAMAVALLATWLLHTAAVAAWWLPPLAAVAALGLSLRRVRPASSPERAGPGRSSSVRARGRLAHDGRGR